MWLLLCLCYKGASQDTERFGEDLKFQNLYGKLGTGTHMPNHTDLGRNAQKVDKVWPGGTCFSISTSFISLGPDALAQMWLLSFLEGIQLPGYKDA